MAIAFTTKQEALDFLRGMRGYYELRNGVFSWYGQYILAYNEESRPDYTPCRYKDGWGIKGIYYYLPNTFYAPTNGRCDIGVKGGFDDAPIYDLVRVNNTDY